MCCFVDRLSKGFWLYGEMNGYLTLSVMVEKHKLALVFLSYFSSEVLFSTHFCLWKKEKVYPGWANN